MGHFTQSVIIVTMFSQDVEKFRYSGDVAELQRYGGPVKIGAQSNVLYPDAFGDIIDMVHDFHQRCIRIQAAVFSDERDVEINANYAFGLTDGIQLFIR